MSGYASEKSTALYWKNGAITQLSDGKNRASATAIFVTKAP